MVIYEDWEKSSHPSRNREYHNWDRHRGVTHVRCLSNGQTSIHKDINPERISSVHIDRMPPMYDCYLSTEEGLKEERFIRGITFEGKGKTSVFEPDNKGMNVAVSFSSDRELLCAVDLQFRELMCKPRGKKIRSE